MNSQENRKLIEEFLENTQGLETLSIKSYLKDGKVSGSLLRRLDSMLEQKELLVQERIKTGGKDYYCSAISQGFLNKDCFNGQCEGCKKMMQNQIK